jgi:hypothetical protein
MADDAPPIDLENSGDIEDAINHAFGPWAYAALQQRLFTDLVRPLMSADCGHMLTRILNLQGNLYDQRWESRHDLSEHPARGSIYNVLDPGAS